MPRSRSSTAYACWMPAMPLAQSNDPPPALSENGNILIIIFNNVNILSARIYRQAHWHFTVIYVYIQITNLFKMTTLYDMIGYDMKMIT